MGYGKHLIHNQERKYLNQVCLKIKMLLTFIHQDTVFKMIHHILNIHDINACFTHDILNNPDITIHLFQCIFSCCNFCDTFE